MPSPFPGMDPYLEAHWLDVHTRLVAYAADELNRVLPDNLVARTEERVAVESGWGDTRAVGRDVRVFSPASADTSESAGAVTVEAPYKLVVQLDPVTERFIRVMDQAGRLVTVIEFLSPTNKIGKGLEAFLEKRGELLEGGVSVVEIDLVRQGDWRGLMRPHVCPPEAVSTYRATVRTPPGGVAYLFPMPLREKLPEIPVLRPRDEKVLLPLQKLMHQVYENGRYARTLDYRASCEPALGADDAEWAQGLLGAAGKR